jgi:hypothetical protein
LIEEKETSMLQTTVPAAGEPLQPLTDADTLSGTGCCLAEAAAGIRAASDAVAASAVPNNLRLGCPRGSILYCLVSPSSMAYAQTNDTPLRFEFRGARC